MPLAAGNPLIRKKYRLTSISAIVVGLAKAIERSTIGFFVSKEGPPNEPDVAPNPESNGSLKLADGL
jgi:hypothetical protein